MRTAVSGSCVQPTECALRSPILRVTMSPGPMIYSDSTDGAQTHWHFHDNGIPSRHYKLSQSTGGGMGALSPNARKYSRYSLGVTAVRIPDNDIIIAKRYSSAVFDVGIRTPCGVRRLGRAWPRPSNTRGGPQNFPSRFKGSISAPADYSGQHIVSATRTALSSTIQF